jgi:hypothetical protein
MATALSIDQNLPLALTTDHWQPPQCMGRLLPSNSLSQDPVCGAASVITCPEEVQQMNPEFRQSS